MNAKKSVDRHIKIFLTNVEKLDNKLRNKNKNPMWVEKYNFVSLLNVPDTMKRHGCKRMLTELDGKGEKGMKSLKKQINGLCRNWAKSAAEKVLKEKSLQNVAKLAGSRIKKDELKCQSVDLMMKFIKRKNTTVDGGGCEDEDEDNNDHTQHDEKTKETNVERNENTEEKLGGSAAQKRNSGFRRHKSKKEAVDAFETGDVVSMVHLKNEKFGIAFKEGKVLKTVSVEVVEWTDEICGANCHRWRLLENEATTIKSENCMDANKETKQRCLLLPKLGKNGIDKQGYDSRFYMITDQWKEMLRDMTIGLPKAKNASY